MLKKVDGVIVLPSLETEKPTHIQVPANKEAQLSARFLHVEYSRTYRDDFRNSI